MRASVKGHSDVVQLLLSAGARLDEKKKVSTSVLYYICTCTYMCEIQ